MKIEDSIAVVTGASSGSGQAIALQLARRNIHGLALVDPHPPPLQLTALIKEHASDSIHFDFHGELADGEFRRRVYREISERCGTANICVALPTVLPGLSGLKRVEAGLIEPLFWAREMVLGIAASRRRNNAATWHISEPMQGIVIVVVPRLLSGREAEKLDSAIKTELKYAMSSLAREADCNGVACEVLSLAENPLLDFRIRATEAGRHFSFIRMEPNVPPQALSEAICCLIENATAPAGVSGKASGARAQGR